MSALFHNHTDGGASIHKPVLLSELLDLLQPAPNENFVDGTTGGGGMAEEVLKRTAPNGKVLCIDIDKRALARAREKLSPKRGRTIFLNGNFKDIDLKQNIRFTYLVLFIFVLTGIVWRPAEMLCFIFFLFVFSGPVGTLVLFLRKKKYATI